MKYLDRLINFIFSLVVLVLSGVIVFISTGFIEYNNASDYVRNNLFSAENNTITCVVGIIVFLAALKTTVFLSKTSPKKKTAIMVDTTHGKIQIASETIETTAKNVAKSHEEVKDVQVRMVKEKKTVRIYMVLLVLPHTNIIELSGKVQNEVKEAIQSTTGVNVSNIDIKVKNLADKGKNTKPVAVKAEVVPEPKEIVANENNDVEVKEENVTLETEVTNKKEETTLENSEENKKEE